MPAALDESKSGFKCQTGRIFQHSLRRATPDLGVWSHIACNRVAGRCRRLLILPRTCCEVLTVFRRLDRTKTTVDRGLGLSKHCRLTLPSFLYAGQGERLHREIRRGEQRGSGGGKSAMVRPLGRGYPDGLIDGEKHHADSRVDPSELSHPSRNGPHLRGLREGHVYYFPINLEAPYYNVAIVLYRRIFLATACSFAVARVYNTRLYLQRCHWSYRW